MTTDAWLGLCEIPTNICKEHDLHPFDTVCISDLELTSTIVQVVPTNLYEIRLHPVLHEFLCRAAADGEDDEVGYRIRAFPFDDIVPCLVPRACWKIDKVPVKSLDDDVELSVTLVYGDSASVSERELQRSLEGRIIKAGSIMVVDTTKGLCILVVHATADLDPGTAYRIGTSVSLKIDRLDPTLDDDDGLEADDSEWETTCPGYESLLEELHSLCRMTGFAAPTGVLLTGCPGVGKTRLLSSLANKVTHQDKGKVRWVSCQDLILRASWATESDLLDILLPSHKAASLLVIDDLDVLSTNDLDESNRDHEYMLVRNSLIRSLDRLSSSDTLVIGICQDASKLPATLVRIDRLEMQIKMEAPSQIQRQAILSSLIPNQWAAALTGPTAGFVAADLRRMHMDAWATGQARSEDITWPDLREAVNRCTPSQLALLDVSRPQVSLKEVCENQLELHNRSWKKFGGYSVVKKRIYRTVVSPWHRHLQSTEPSAFGLSPPRGVLFHGPSGTGKTFAAGCLASSLGLNVVKVRAADVLDQWLGGSEAAIRSLFQRARGAAPCILYFDEIDAIACDREKEGTESDVSSRILTTLLNEMDGISSTSNSGVLVLACTNRLQDLDAALLRPGRLEEHIELTLPSTDDVREILESHLSNVPLSDDLNLEEFAEVFFELNATAADIEGVCRDACSIAIRAIDNPDSISLTYSILDRALRNWKR